PIIFTITLKEIYDIFNEDHVLEYTYKPAKHRLYYDEKSARDPSILWLEAIKFFT
ncbi:547_t:CDS:1, partial [Funneliformis geosporum]